MATVPGSRDRAATRRAADPLLDDDTEPTIASTRDRPRGSESLRRRADPDRRAAWGVFLVLLCLYALSAGGHTYSSDEEGMYATTRSLAAERDPTVEITDENRGLVPARVGRDGRIVGVSGIAHSMAAVPLYAAGAAVARTVAPAYRDYTARVFTGFLNSVATAAGAAVVFLMSRRLGARRRHAIGLAIAYGVGTFAWPHAKTFFSEPLATTFAVAAAYFAVAAFPARRWQPLALSGACVGLSMSARFSSVLFLVPISAYVAWKAVVSPARARALAHATAAFCAGFVPVMALLGLTNWWRFGDPLDVGYERVPLTFPVHEGLYGLFLSPGKSVFLYAPVTLVGVLAIAFAPRARRAEVIMLAACALANAMFFARFFQWHGDHSWGPRYLTMSVPFMVLPLATKMAVPVWRRATLAAGAVGVAVSALGAVMYFNQYFDIAHHTIPWTMEADGPTYWRKLHYDPYWSPIAGHARAMPDVAVNTLDRFDGDAVGLQPFPREIKGRYTWYFAPPQLDAWWYWVFAAHGPKKLLLLVPAFLGAGAVGVVRLRRAWSAPDSADSPDSPDSAH